MPGFANRLVAQFVSGAAVHFEETAKYFRHGEVTGVPVRQAFFRDSAQARRHADGAGFRREPGRARDQRSDDSAACPSCSARLRGFTSFTRPASVTIMTRWLPTGRWESRREVFKFIEDMPAAFARADLVVCRSGASTVAEIAAAGKPAVFVPFPRAADDHQRVNAEALAQSRRRGCGRRIEAGRRLAGGDNRRVAAGSAASATDEPRGAGVGASERCARHRGDGSAGGGN